jgi:general L-amino acid transport system permease protein
VSRPATAHLGGKSPREIVDAKWVGFGVEVYLFAAAIYFAFCYIVSRFSLRLERELRAGC